MSPAISNRRGTALPFRGSGASVPGGPDDQPAIPGGSGASANQPVPSGPAIPGGGKVNQTTSTPKAVWDTALEELAKDPPRSPQNRDAFLRGYLSLEGISPAHANELFRREELKPPEEQFKPPEKADPEES